MNTRKIFPFICVLFFSTCSFSSDQRSLVPFGSSDSGGCSFSIEEVSSSALKLGWKYRKEIGCVLSGTVPTIGLWLLSNARKNKRLQEKNEEVAKLNKKTLTLKKKLDEENKKNNTLTDLLSKQNQIAQNVEQLSKAVEGLGTPLQTSNET